MASEVVERTEEFSKIAFNFFFEANQKDFGQAQNFSYKGIQKWGFEFVPQSFLLRRWGQVLTWAGGPGWEALQQAWRAVAG